MESNKRYGIYGGSFDPIHIGHVALAESAVRECGLDKLIFMPAYISPFKQDRKVTDGHDRCMMIEAVLKTNSAFCLSKYELNREGPSYTIETLRHWKNLLDGELYFILGFDSTVQVDKWYQGEEILRNYHLVTARRPDTDYVDGLKIIKSFREKIRCENNRHEYDTGQGFINRDQKPYKRRKEYNGTRAAGSRGLHN